MLCTRARVLRLRRLRQQLVCGCVCVHVCSNAACPYNQVLKKAGTKGQLAIIAILTALLIILFLIAFM